jgi:hypothetical protein
VKVEHDVPEHCENALAVRVRDADPEDGPPELALHDRLLKPVPPTTQTNLLISLCRDLTPPGSDPVLLRRDLTPSGSDPATFL